MMLIYRSTCYKFIYMHKVHFIYKHKVSIAEQHVQTFFYILHFQKVFTIIFIYLMSIQATSIIYTSVFIFMILLFFIFYYTFNLDLLYYIKSIFFIIYKDLWTKPMNK
uniref:Uncharacterized protein n=1 Tax=Cacopsylla melanoneura TaxID=428564 RepID=A0A8D8SQI4_9HEMI